MMGIMKVNVELVTSLILCFPLACSNTEPASDKPCNPAESACELTHTLEEITIAPGEEIEALCQTWALNNAETLWISEVEMSNLGGVHHTNWLYVPDDLYDIPGTWVCSEHEYNEIVAAVEGGLLMLASTQSRAETQTLAPGTAIRIPPYSRIVAGTHVLNTGDEPITTEIGMRLVTMPEQEVEIQLVPGHTRNKDIALPPHAASSFTSECEIASTYQNLLSRPMDVKIHYVSPHYHQLGTYFEMAYLGGPRDGEVFYRHDGYGENFGHRFDPPIDLTAAEATGYSFTCGYMNPRDETVYWGLADQEMCMNVMLLDTDMAFSGDILTGTSEYVGTAEDGTMMYRAPCWVTGLVWDDNKPGGPSRDETLP